MKTTSDITIYALHSQPTEMGCATWGECGKFHPLHIIFSDGKMILLYLFKDEDENCNN